MRQQYKTLNTGNLYVITRLLNGEHLVQATFTDVYVAMVSALLACFVAMVSAEVACFAAMVSAHPHSGYIVCWP